MSIIKAVTNFSDELSRTGYNFEELAIEMPYNMRLRLQQEMIQSIHSYNIDRFRGRISGFTINTPQAIITINSLQSEREEVLRLELTKIEERAKEIKKQLGS